jgi:hypothetical protein
MDKLVQSKIATPKVGCFEHKYDLLKQIFYPRVQLKSSLQIFYYYLTTRMYFASRVHRKQNESICKS